jgi:hypothetical protein
MADDEFKIGFLPEVVSDVLADLMRYSVCRGRSATQPAEEVPNPQSVMIAR